MIWPLESIIYNLLGLQSLDFKELTEPLTRRVGLPCQCYFDLSSIITVAVNWIVVEVVTSSWGFLWIVFAAGAGIARKIYEHFEVH
jgi:hypothetical protein